MIEVGVWGDIARLCLESENHGTVEAAFESSLYLRNQHGTVVCILPCDNEAGPLHAVLTTPWVAELSTLRQHDSWRAHPGGVNVGTVHLKHQNATTWTPPVCSGISRAPNRNVLLQLLAGAPAGSLASAFTSNTDPSGAPWMSHGRLAIAQLEVWLDNKTDELKVESLVGLGPGLTPSGDDLLGALAITFAVQGDSARARALKTAVAQRLHTTHPLSAAHLSAALDGKGVEALHLVAIALATGKLPSPGSLKRLTSLGGQSGWDMLAGIALALGLRLGPNPQSPHSPPQILEST